MIVIQYTTAGCHLCEQALALLEETSKINDINIKLVEIGDDDNLVNQFGVHIPVVEFPDQQRLYWPFDLTELNQKIQEQSSSYT
ncbi:MULTISPECIES: glutaredoxin family protein [Methylophaga]|jgi:glutaredoxin|uniref:Glutaredoxin family protein n=1 Tax=Methylophaga marina TaxID=45495 RepID=A0ABP3CQH9_9GAMM|nr:MULTISPECIES: glutaredoxin family protein [Methylophaga]MAX53047.1 thioredoxin family protein [Methylophaga sp.]BDZ73237.1 thioredoxin family protein [Methylophaga marina]|tara:strand:- start:17534 stop:17785 length:252 start_codon:yes stop_codon:yes gene_type:complete